jgi:hypothetical protein
MKWLAVPCYRKETKKRGDEAYRRWWIHMPFQFRENLSLHFLERLDIKHASAELHKGVDSKLAWRSFDGIRLAMKLDGKVETRNSNELELLPWYGAWVVFVVCAIVRSK